MKNKQNNFDQRNMLSKKVLLSSIFIHCYQLKLMGILVNIDNCATDKKHLCAIRDKTSGRPVVSHFLLTL